MRTIVVCAFLLVAALVVPLNPAFLNINKGYREASLNLSSSAEKDAASSSSSAADVHEALSDKRIVHNRDRGMLGNSTALQYCFTPSDSSLCSLQENGHGTRLTVRIDESQRWQDCFAILRNIASESLGKIVRTVTMASKTIACIVEVPSEAASDFVERVKKAGVSRYIEDSVKFNATFVPNDPQFYSQWGLWNIQAPETWDVQRGSKSVMVAVIDTGIEYSHPDLASNYVPLGYDWANDDADPLDDNGHGTHCAGIIAAAINNSIGVAGLAQVRIMAEKGLTGEGWGYDYWLAEAIIHATENGANIISMSWGGYEQSSLLQEAVKYAYENGVLLVAAAGNDAVTLKHYPAAYPEVIAVAATDEYDYYTSWTNYGDWIELSAPGLQIYSTFLNGSYSQKSGTSMAAPYVAGVAALVWSQLPNASRDWVRLRLRYTADLARDARTVRWCKTRVNAFKAVADSVPQHDLLVSRWQTPSFVEPGTASTIDVVVSNNGVNEENNVVLYLLANGSVVDTAAIGSLGALWSERISLNWHPVAKGKYNITVSLPTVLGETDLRDNAVQTSIFVGHPTKALVLDYPGTNLPSICANWQALNDNWTRYGDRMIYVDYATLATSELTYENIAATDSDVLIISHGWVMSPGLDVVVTEQFTDSEIEAITRYVKEGHGLIVLGSVLNAYLPNNCKLAPLLGMDESLRTAYQGVDHIYAIEPSHPLFAKIPEKWNFSQSKWSETPFDLLWDSNELGEGKYVAKSRFNGNAIVTSKGLVYASPWLESLSPSSGNLHLQFFYNAITWSRYQKEQHDLSASIEVPYHMTPGESAMINATFFNIGVSDETDMEIQILVDGKLAKTETVSWLPSGASYSVSHIWNAPVQEAGHIVTACVTPVSGEVSTKDNTASKVVTTISIAVSRVLVYSDDLLPQSLIYPLVALRNLGVDYAYFVSNPASFLDALSTQSWELVIVDHCGWFEFDRCWSALGQYTRNGGRLVLSTFLVHSWWGSAPEAFLDMLGAKWAKDMFFFQETVRVWDTEHPVFTFPNEVGDLSFPLVGSYDNGDHLTATTGIPIAGFTKSPTEDYAGVVVGRNHRTILMSFVLSDFRLDKNGDGKLDAVALWENAVTFILRCPEHDLATVVEAPRLLEPSTTARLKATVVNSGLEYETAVQLRLLVNNNVMASVTIPELPAGSLYTLQYDWTPTVPGVYNVAAFTPTLPSESESQNNLCTKAVVVGYAIKAAVIHSVGTEVPDVITMWQTLSSRWSDYGGAPVSIDYSALNTININYSDLAAINADVLIIASGSIREFTDSEIEAITQYTLEGHGLIATFDTFSEKVPKNDKLASLFGISERIKWTTTQTSQLNLVNSTHPLFRSIPTTYTFPARNTTAPVNGQWSEESLTVGRFEALGAYGESAIVTYNGLVYVSTAIEDGFTAFDLQLLYNAITWSRYQAQEHELVAFAHVPPWPRVFTQHHIEAKIVNSGSHTETMVELQMLIDSIVVDRVVVPELASGNSYSRSCSWTPARLGEHNVTIYVRPVQGEKIESNNIATKIARATYKPRVLLLQTNVWTHAGQAILDYFNYEFTTVSIADFATVNLYDYQLLFVNESPGNEPVDALFARRSEIADWVASGNAIVAFYQNSEKQRWQWLPLSVTPAPALWPEVHIVNPAHPIMSNFSDSDLSNFAWQFCTYLGCFVAQDTAWTPLAVGKAENKPIVLAAAYGKGRIVISQQDIDQRVFHIAWDIAFDEPIYKAAERYLKNIFEWVAPTILQEHDIAVSVTAPPNLVAGTPVTLRVTTANEGLNSEAGVKTHVLINGSEVASDLIPALLSENWHVLIYQWIPTATGTYNITAYADTVPNERGTRNNAATKRVSVSAAAETYVSLNPPTISVLFGNSFPVDVSINHAANITFSRFEIYYRNDVLEAIEAAEGSFFAQGGDTAFHCEIDNAHNNSYGMIKVEAYLTAPSYFGVSGDGILAKIRFKAKIPRNSIVQLCNVLVFSDAARYALSTSCALEIVKPLVQDINWDGKIDLRDVLGTASAYGSFPGHPRWNALADVNADGKIDLKDYMFIAKSFGKTYP